ncbi:hypothetical protein PVK06_010972 [Gossypium arboreum]|uniref:Uncharacterized protein n=1 Tax=Gossypium arboreum TaxID=29729 RepID=A0ABR0Q7I7_GOSAR|nr:hypothetical protein PVK06_010972 [Gossypium arboreum]
MAHTATLEPPHSRVLCTTMPSSTTRLCTHTRPTTWVTTCPYISGINSMQK